jgi:hypothetical protein
MMIIAPGPPADESAGVIYAWLVSAIATLLIVAAYFKAEWRQPEENSLRRKAEEELAYHFDRKGGAAKPDKTTIG